MTRAAVRQARCILCGAPCDGRTCRAHDGIEVDAAPADPLESLPMQAAETQPEVTPDSLLMVTAPQLLQAVEDMPYAAQLRNGVSVTRAQLRKAAEILRAAPQPYCNGLYSDMPGFIDRAAQKGKSLVFQVGILPTRTYRIDRLGRVRGRVRETEPC